MLVNMHGVHKVWRCRGYNCSVWRWCPKLSWTCPNRTVHFSCMCSIICFVPNVVILSLIFYVTWSKNPYSGGPQCYVLLQMCTCIMYKFGLCPCVTGFMCSMCLHWCILKHKQVGIKYFVFIFMLQMYCLDQYLLHTECYPSSLNLLCLINCCYTYVWGIVVYQSWYGLAHHTAVCLWRKRTETISHGVSLFLSILELGLSLHQGSDSHFLCHSRWL